MFNESKALNYHRTFPLSIATQFLWMPLSHLTYSFLVSPSSQRRTRTPTTLREHLERIHMENLKTHSGDDLDPLCPEKCLKNVSSCMHDARAKKKGRHRAEYKWKKQHVTQHGPIRVSKHGDERRKQKKSGTRWNISIWHLPVRNQRRGQSRVWHEHSLMGGTFWRIQRSRGIGKNTRYATASFLCCDDSNGYRQRRLVAQRTQRAKHRRRPSWEKPRSGGARRASTCRAEPCPLVRNTGMAQRQSQSREKIPTETVLSKAQLARHSDTNKRMLSGSNARANQEPTQGRNQWRTRNTRQHADKAARWPQDKTSARSCPNVAVHALVLPTVCKLWYGGGSWPRAVSSIRVNSCSSSMVW